AGGGDGGAKALRAPSPLVVSVAGDAEDGAAHGDVVAFAEELEEAALAEGEDHRWLAIGRRFRRRTGVRGELRGPGLRLGFGDVDGGVRSGWCGVRFWVCRFHEGSSWIGGRGMVAREQSCDCTDGFSENGLGGEGGMGECSVFSAG